MTATGLARSRPPGRVDRRHLAAVVERLGVLQLDSVNVVGRAHDLVLFSRLGPHPPDLLHGAAYRRRELVEAWCHEASLVPVAHWPLLEWRREEVRANPRWQRWADASAVAVAEVEARLASEGPMTAQEVQGAPVHRGPWWGWSETKRALEYLFAIGRVGVAGRTGPTGFERSYDLIERVVPDELRSTTVAEGEARKALLLVAARAQGVGTAHDLADHHRQRVSKVRRLVEELAEAGELERVAVEGWREPAFLHPRASRPRRLRAAALVGPFDPVVWNRRRAELLFDFRFRIEIYTPAPDRVHGYYVLPFVLDDRIVARVDAKADRKAGVLRAHACFGEAGAEPEEVAPPLAAELWQLAAFHRLPAVEVGPRGDLAGPLAAAVSRSSGMAGPA